MSREGWGYLKGYDCLVRSLPTSHYFIPITECEGGEDEEVGEPLCGQGFNYDSYRIVIEKTDRPKCKKCLKALAKSGEGK